MSEQKFFICEICGNLVGLLEDSGVPLNCCGMDMTELVPNTSDGAAEKHVPVVTVTDNNVVVCIGEVAHPMTSDHYIQWIYLQTKQGGQRKALQPGDEPTAAFALASGDEAVAAFAYCNLHGLWKCDI